MNDNLSNNKVLLYKKKEKEKLIENMWTMAYQYFNGVSNISVQIFL